jgi:hypothetical protein
MFDSNFSIPHSQTIPVSFRVSDSTSFAGVSWRAADTLDRVIGAGAARPIVVVAPYNTGARIDEYTPVKDPGYRYRYGQCSVFLVSHWFTWSMPNTLEESRSRMSSAVYHHF